MKKTIKSILAIIMACIMASGFVTAFAVEEVLYPYDYVEKVEVTNYEKCSTIQRTYYGELIIPSTEGETITIYFVDGTEKSFVYAEGVSIDFPDGKEYEVYAGIDGVSLGHAVWVIGEDGEEYMIWLGFSEIVDIEPEFDFETAKDYYELKLGRIVQRFIADNHWLGAPDWQNTARVIGALPGLIKDVSDLTSYVIGKVIEHYTA